MAEFPRLLHHGPFPPAPARAERLAALRADPDADPEEVAAAEADLAASIVAIQRDIGAPAQSDGAAPALADGFLAGLCGVEVVEVEAGRDGLRADDHPAFAADHPWVARGARLAALAPASGFLALPGPARWDVATGRDAPSALAEPEALHARLAAALAEALRALHGAGVAHIVIDGLALAPGGGRAPRPLEGLALLAAALADRPVELRVTLAVSRAAFAALTAAAGDDPEGAAEALAAVPADALMAPLREASDMTALSALAGAPRRILLGAIDAAGREPRRGDHDAPRRAVDAAARLLDPDRLGLCPDGAFALEGAAALAEDDAKRKLDLMVRAAEAIWGDVSG
ncbi:hypothetical protein [Rubrimonas cliftonensis]|nr:hypothetical protein [Rubrimonas cliftonensis]